MLLAGILGLLPFFAWIVFSVIYYGYPFPNTYYAKVQTGISLMDYLLKGLNFVITGFLCDSITMVTIVIAMIILIRKGDFLRRMIALGMFMKFAYIIRIGGDFMLGRHFAGLFIVSVYIIFEHAERNEWFDKKKLATAGGVITVLCLDSLLINPVILYPLNDADDERSGYYQHSSLYRIIKSGIDKENYPLKSYQNYLPSVTKRIDAGYKGDVVLFAPGVIVYNYGDRIYLADQMALADPLLPYMDIDWGVTSVFVAKNRKWRIGHVNRSVPDGYRESLQQDANLIKDPEIHELYDKILLVVRGDNLFSKERFKAIWELNTKYRHFKAGN